MPRAKKIAKEWTPPTKAKIPPLEEGTYPTLAGYTGLTRPAHWKMRCMQCKTQCSKTWDTIINGGRYSFCKGECLYEYLTERSKRLVEDLFNGKVLTDKEYAETIKQEELKHAYFSRYGVWPN